MKLNYVFKKSNFFHMAWLICILFPFIQQRTYGELPGIIGTFYKYTALLSALFVYAFSVFNYRYLKGKKYLIIFALYFLANIVTTFLKCPAGLAGVLNHAIVHMAINSFYFTRSGKRHYFFIKGSCNYLWRIYISEFYHRYNFSARLV